jgi:CheY-like chemotaxis protein/HPt (histidine-containing phosphotransfer) domain-containing protein
MAADEASPAAEEIQFQGRVLLAEDGEDNRDLIASHLYRAGLEVGIASTGRLAVEAAMNNHFDLILMDMQMPELDGYEATGALRAAGLTLPIIAVTANAMAEDRIRCLQAGCTDYLAKPISRSELMQALRRFLPGSQPAPGPQKTTATPLVATTATIASSVPQSAPPAATTKSEPADDAMARLLIRFVSKLPERVARIESLARENDLENLRQAVHQLRGAAGGYGFPQVTELAGRTENSIRDGDPVEMIKKEVDLLVELVRSIDGYDPRGEITAPSSADNAPSHS